MGSTISRCRVALLCAVLSAGCTGSGDDTESTIESLRPALVVTLVIDQLRPDLLDRYDDLYVGGFRRLLDGGFRFGAVHDHAHTETAAGHATLSTGVFPSRSGIPGNEWHEWDGDRWRSVYAVFDSTSPILDHPELRGRSPANLQRTGLADWLLSADAASQVVSLSRKDRSAITMAGKAKGTVLWIAPSAGRFVTSRYYASQLADWVKAFNRDSMPRLYSDSTWWSGLSPEHAARVRPDSAAYEMDGVHVAFPHRFGELTGTADESDFGTWVTEHTPRPDAAVLALARVAIRELGLGGDSAPDLLSLSLSQTDAVGHDYGPLSVEQLDNLLRLDRELGLFFDFLDADVGAGRWVLGLSADHGVMTSPEAMETNGPVGRRISGRDMSPALELAGSAAIDGPESGSADRVARALETLPWIERAFPVARLADRDVVGDTVFDLFRNSTVPGRLMGPLYRYGVDVQFAEGSIRERYGTTHGSAWLYDRQVPLLFYGAAVSTGWSAERARTVDFAPTLARLAGVGVPADLDGRSLAPLMARR